MHSQYTKGKEGGLGKWGQESHRLCQFLFCMGESERECVDANQCTDRPSCGNRNNDNKNSHNSSRFDDYQFWWQAGTGLLLLYCSQKSRCKDEMGMTSDEMNGWRRVDCSIERSSMRGQEGVLSISQLTCRCQNGRRNQRRWRPLRLQLLLAPRLPLSLLRLLLPSPSFLQISSL